MDRNESLTNDVPPIAMFSFLVVISSLNGYYRRRTNASQVGIAYSYMFGKWKHMQIIASLNRTKTA